MISIVTGTLNRINLLKYVISNTVDKNNNIELVLVDGGSTDGTIEYIKKINNPQIKLIEIGKRSPYPHFMNIGIKNSKYEWIVQWNDDVLLLNDWNDVFDILNDDKDVYIFDWTRGKLGDINNKNVNDIEPKKFGSHWISFKDCMNFGVYKKSIFREIGMYDSKFKYYECDHDMTTRCLLFGYNIVNVHNIKVFEIKIDKSAINDKYDNKLYYDNRKLYTRRILPETIEKL